MSSTIKVFLKHRFFFQRFKIPFRTWKTSDFFASTQYYVRVHPAPLPQFLGFFAPHATQTAFGGLPRVLLGQCLQGVCPGHSNCRSHSVLEKFCWVLATHRCFGPRLVLFSGPEAVDFFTSSCYKYLKSFPYLFCLLPPFPVWPFPAAPCPIQQVVAGTQR